MSPALLLALALGNELAAPPMLARAHSHNDYLRARPLEEALENGFGSVEVDVFPVQGKLMVAHDRKGIRPERTLESLYLKPLADRVNRNKGRVYDGEQEALQVLVDVKADGAAAYEALKSTLARFPTLQYRGKGSPVRFVISGDRAVDRIVRDGGKSAALDGRWADLGQGYSVEMMPMVSQAWLDHFKWIGAGEFPPEMVAKLKEMAGKVHAEGRTLRFWGAPDLPAIWEVHWRLGVDWINTDRPATLGRWMKDRSVRGSAGNTFDTNLAKAISHISES